mgnify:CR=1 FL=1
MLKGIKKIGGEGNQKSKEEEEISKVRSLVDTSKLKEEAIME